MNLFFRSKSCFLKTFQKKKAIREKKSKIKFFLWEKKCISGLEYTVLDLCTQRDVLWFRPNVSARLSLSVEVGDMALIFGRISRYCALVFYFKDYYTAIQISSKFKHFWWLAPQKTENGFFLENWSKNRKFHIHQVINWK